MKPSVLFDLLAPVNPTNPIRLEDIGAGLKFNTTSKKVEVSIGSGLELDVDGKLNATGGGSGGSVTPTLAKRFVVKIGDGSLKTFTVNHNLGSSDVIVTAYDATTLQMTIVDIKIIDDNNVKIDTDEAPTTNGLKIIVM